jgi:FlaA1/EpsC-like NDP-sugar epimerase
MTISEAVQLTLQAAARGKSGEVLVLEMGQPVRITEVARQIVEELKTPIEIVFTGLRPGEKLHESLFGVGDADPRRVHPSITSCSVPPISVSNCWSIEADASPELVKGALKVLCLADSSELELVDEEYY